MTTSSPACAPPCATCPPARRWRRRSLRAPAAADAATPSRASPSAWPTTAPTVREADDLAATIARVCAEHGARRARRADRRCSRGGGPSGLELVEDDGLSARELDALDGALTGCALAIAETGTIVLDGGERSGRRALTLVPDLHLCVVERAQVVATVPDAIRALDGARGPVHLRLGPERHERHRARPRRGRPRPAPARGAAASSGAAGQVAVPGLDRDGLVAPQVARR